MAAQTKGGTRVLAVGIGRSARDGTGVAIAGGGSGAAPAGGAAAGAGAPAVTAAANRVKKSSAILRAVASINREPICASLPPTCACTLYDSIVPPPSSVRLTCAPPLAKPATPPWPSPLIV